MRASLRLAGYALLLLSGVTCTESPTAPRNARHGMTASLSLQPSFSRDAQAALSNLGAFGLNVDNVHIHIEHPPAAPLDTVIPFPANADSIVLSLSIQLNAPTEQLSALIELRQGSQVLFSGTQTLFASVTGTPSQPNSPVPITYVGPGASARTLNIAPRDTAIIGAGSFAYRYALLDANGTNVVGAQPAWSISDPTIGSIDPATGLFTASGKRGTARIVAATINGLRDSTTVVVANQPTKLVAVSGTGQTAAAGTPLAQPLVVQAQASDGSAVPGVRVNFATTVAGASFNPVSGVTDLNGNLQTTVTLGHTAGAQAFTALSAGLTSATATETATAAAAAQLAKVSGDLQSDSINAVLPQPFVVRVTDAYGNVASGATVNWTRIAGGGTLAATTSASDSTGIARVGYTLGTTARTDSVQAALVGVNAATALFTARSYAAGPTAIAIASGDAQSADAGTPLPAPLVVRVTDKAKNAVPGAVVHWALAGGNGRLSAPQTTTDSTGTTSVTLTLAATAGANLVTASLSDGGPSVTFKETGVVGAAANVAKVAGDNQVGTPNTLLPVKPQVRVTDGHGNPVPGWSVAFSVTGGGGSVTGATPVTDDQGLASVGGWTLGASGPQSLKATVNGVSVTFTASAGAPAPSAATSLRFTTQPSNAPSVTYITPSIQVSVLDQYGNVLTSGTGSTARVALGVLHGPVGGVIRDSVGFAGDTVNAVAGVATFKVGGNIAGTYKLLATSPGLASDSSAAFSITVGTPNRVQYVSGDGQTALANDSLPLRPTVIVQDGGGNPVPLGKVVFVVDSGEGSINVPPQPGPAVAVDTVTADGAGHASVKWFLCGCASQELIAFTPGSSVDTVRFHATVIQPATQIAITSQMNQSYASNTHLPLVAQLEDDNGNPVRQAGVALIARVMLNIDYNRAAPSRAPRGARVQRAPGSRAPAPSLAPQLLPSPYERLSRALAQSRVRRIVVGGRARRDVTMSTSGVWDSLPSVPQPYLYGAVVAVTDSTGTAAFPSLYVAGAVNQYFGLEVDDTSSTSTLYPAYDYTGYYLTPGAPANVLAAYDSVHQAIGQPVIDAPQAFVADSAGNGVPGVPVTLSIAAGGGSLSSTSATSDASGFVTLTGWMLGASPGVNQATASVAVGQATRSATLTATGHAPGALGMLVDLPLSVVDSVTISPAPQVQVLDSTSTWALNAPGVVITPAVRLSPPKDVQSPRLVGSTNAVTSGTDGSATFSGVGIVGTFGSTVQMVFTAPNLIGVASDTASIASGPAASLGVPMGESLDSTHVVGATTRQVAVLVTDTSRYGVGGVPVTFTISGTGSTCQLPGNASSYTTNTSASGQAFATISLQAAAGSCAIVATSTAVPSQVVTFRELVVPPNYDTWLGLQDSNWQNAANWSTSAVPTAADSVFVPYALTYGAFGGNAPMLGAAADVATLLVENGAQLDLNGYAMNVHGNLGNGTSSAWTTATQDRGSIVMLAPGASVAGVLPYKLVIGDGTAACPGGAPVKASGTLSADSLVINCPFDVNGVTLNVSGDMTVTHHGILQATTGNPQMFVGRNFTVNSDQASTNLMTAGDLQIVGNFVEDTVATMPGSYHNFDPGAGFSVTMREYGYNYGSPASISFTSPYAQFGALYIAQGGSTVTLSGSNGQAYTVNGLLSIGNTIYPPATLVIPAGITLNVQSTFSIGSNGRVQVSGAMHLAQTWQCLVQSFVTMLGSGTVTPACSTP